MSVDNKKEYKETWFIVPIYIAELPGMTLGYLKVYQTIFQFWNKGLDCFLSNSAITERTGVADREIFRALNFFEQQNQLERKQIGLKRYLMQPQKSIETDITQDRQLGHPPLTIGSPTPDVIVIHNIKNLNKELNAAGAAFSAASLPLSPITPVELIAVYHEVLPDNPKVLINPVTGEIEPKVNKAIRAFKKYWLRRAGSPITIDDFKTYMMDLRNNCSGFTLNSYIGKGGNEQKNGLVTFLDWVTVENVNANNKLY